MEVADADGAAHLLGAGAQEDTVGGGIRELGHVGGIDNAVRGGRVVGIGQITVNGRIRNIRTGLRNGRRDGRIFGVHNREHVEEILAVSNGREQGSSGS